MSIFWAVRKAISEEGCVGSGEGPEEVYKNDPRNE